jgi:hypothetical protein
MNRNQGMTLIGMLLTLAVVVAVGITLLRVVPVYIQHYEVMTSIKSLNSLPSSDFSTDPASNAAVLRSKLLNQLYVNSIESITPDQIIITPDDKGNFTITIKYQVIRPLVANIRLLFDFETTQGVTVSEQ